MATHSREGLGIERLRSLPLGLLRPSALVDFILLFVCEKRAVRLIVKSEEGLEALQQWARRWVFDFASDGEGFASISVERGSASRVLDIDRRADAHEMELGHILSYPRCCCERVAFVGESNIDSHAVVVAGWPFEGEYRRINPAGYRSGLALISHLPCSTVCDASLVIANRARGFVLEHRREPILADLSRSPVMSA